MKHGKKINRTQWFIKNADLKEILQDAGSDEILSLNTGAFGVFITYKKEYDKLMKEKGIKNEG